MTRKDSEKDAERPHYYSQFWLDIAAGRRVIGGPKPEDAETQEPEVPEPAPLRKAGRSGAEAVKETRASAVAEPEIEEEEEFEQDNTVEESDMPTIVFDEDTELAEEAEEDLNEEELDSEDEEFFEDDEEDEDDEEWGRRGGRKKAKPARPTKPVKKPKRDTRRNF